MPKPAWMGKHPCVGCGAGYIECAQSWTFNRQCCVSCEHPGRWNTEPPYSAEEIADMQNLAEQRSQ